MKKMKILLVDDHEMVRDGIRAMLEVHRKKYKFEIDEAENGEECIEKSMTHYDIIIMDYQLPKINGAETARLVISRNPKTRILALSNYNEYMYIDAMIKAGVNGFILKNIGPEELIKAIEYVLSGKTYFSSEVATKLLEFNENELKKEKERKEAPHDEPLSRRESEVLKLIVDGCTSGEIGKRLYISKRTVDAHRQNIMYKLNANCVADLVKYSISESI